MKPHELNALVGKFLESIAKENEDRIGSYAMPTLYNFAMWLDESGYFNRSKLPLDTEPKKNEGS